MKKSVKNRVIFPAFLAFGVALALYLYLFDRETKADPVPRFDFKTLPPSWLLDAVAIPERKGDVPKQSISASERANEIINLLLEKEPVRGLPYGFMTRDTNVIENYSKGVLHVLGSDDDPIRFSVPMKWTFPERSSTFHAELHSWRHLTPFIREYRRTGKREFLKVAISMIRDWLKQNPYPEGKHRRAWHEGSVVKRLPILIELLNAYREKGPMEEFPHHKLLALLYQHVRFLTKEDVYTGLGNHGLRQCIMLYIAATALPEFKEAKGWEALALRRLEEQVESGFSSEAGWREHSPFYHYYVLSLLDQFEHFLTQNDQELPKWLPSLQHGAKDLLAWMVSPDGKLVPIGDTRTINPNLDAIAPVSPALRFAATLGAQGVPPARLDRFCPDLGQAVMRDRWGSTPKSYQESFYIHIHAAQHRLLGMGHRHEDALSFVVHGYGRWWICEGGKYGYDRDKWRSYFIGAQAHNTYVANGESLHPLSKRKLRAWLLKDTISKPQLAAAVAISERFPVAARVSRVYVFLREKKCLILLDNLQANEEISWQSFTHLAPDLIVSTDGDQVIAYPGDEQGPILEITTVLDGKDKINVAKGQENPILGWVCGGRSGKLVPCPTVVVERVRKTTWVPTVIRWRFQALEKLSQLKHDTENGMHIITWQEGDMTATVTLRLEPKLTVDYNESPSG